MGALINREISYDSGISFLEHRTGKKVKSYYRNPQWFSTDIIFTDGTYIQIKEGYETDWNNLQFKEVPKSYCASCGELAHFSSFDWRERCEVQVKRFWEKVRKVYWHRYSKNKVTNS